MGDLLVERDEAVLKLTMNRPERRNALNASMIGTLSEALAGAATDDTTQVIVLTGAGTAFSAGADLAELEALQGGSLLENRRSSQQLAALFAAMRIHPKVIVAQVNGHAIAGGAGLMAACDFAVVDERAKLGFTEVRIGFVPAIISSFVRSRIDDMTLRELFLTGRLLTAEEARICGLVQRVVPESEMAETVKTLVDEIIDSTSSTAVALTKRMLVATEGMSSAQAATYLAAFNALVRQTDACRDGVRSFLDKRSSR